MSDSFTLSDLMVSNRPLDLSPKGLLPVQRDIMTTVEDGMVAHLPGSWRGGKTAGAILKLMMHSRRRHGGNYITASPSREQTKRIIDQYIYQVGNFLNVPVTQSGWTWKVGSNTWWIFGASDKRSVGRMAGITAHGALFEELSEISPEFYAMGLSRCSTEGRIVLTNCNPQGPYHWINQELIGKAHLTGDVVLESAKTAVNDNHYLGTAYVEEMRKRLPPHLIKRGLEGEWVVAEGLVYPDFEVRSLAPISRRGPVVGVDYGWGRGGITTAIAVRHYPGDPFVQIHGWYGAESEYYHVGPLDPNTHALRILNRWPDAVGFVIDASYPPLYEALLRRAPGRVVRARKEEGTVLRGVNHVNAMMLARTLVVNEAEKVPNLTRELYTYVWSPILAPVSGNDRPLKEHDHCCDALRYAVEHIIERNEVVLND